MAMQTKSVEESGLFQFTVSMACRFVVWSKPLSVLPAILRDDRRPGSVT
jgi:hypothetical protein